MNFLALAFWMEKSLYFDSVNSSFQNGVQKQHALALTKKALVMLHKSYKMKKLERNAVTHRYY